MAKKYTFEEFRWHFLAKEVRRFDLRKPDDLGRYMAYHSLRKNMSQQEKIELDGGETREVKEGLIVKILCIKNHEVSSSYGVSYSLNKTG